MSQIERTMEALKKLSEFLRSPAPDTTGLKGNTSPDRIGRRKLAAERLTGKKTRELESLTQSEKWVTQAAVGTPAERASAQRDVQVDVYKADLDASREALKAAQAGDQNRTPDFLPKDADAIKIPAIASFVAEVTNLPKELQNDPNTLVRLTSKLYRSTDWNSLDRPDKLEARGVVDAAIERAKSLSAQSPDSFLDIASQPNADYLINRAVSGDTGDKKFDFYRSRITKNELTTPTSGGGGRGGRGKDRGQELEQSLRRAQRKIDDQLSWQDEKGALKEIVNKLGDAIEQGVIPRDEGEAFKKIALERGRDLEQRSAQERGPSGGRQQRGGAVEARAPITQVEIDQMISDFPPEAEPLVRSILELPNRDVSLEDLQHLRKMLRDQVDGASLGRRINQQTAGLDQEAFLKQINDRLKLRAKLEEMIYDKSVPLTEGQRAERGFYTKTENAKYWDFLISDWAVPSKDPKAWNADASTKSLIENAHRILDKGDSNMSASFRENFDLFDQGDWKTFIGKIEARLRRVVNEKGERIWTDFDIERYRSKFMAIREMRDLVHDVQLMESVSNLEGLNKITVNALSGDFDVWFDNTKGLRLAMSMQMSNLSSVMAQSNGYLNPEDVALNPEFRSRWRDLAEAQFKQAVDSGTIESVKGMTDEEMNRALRIARSFGIITLRTPVVMSQAKIPKNFISSYANGLVSDIDWLRYGITKYGIGSPGLITLYRQVTGDLEGAKLMKGMSDSEAMQSFIAGLEDPRFADSVANYRNMFKLADRFGDGKSLWGLVTASKHWSSEMREVRGIGVKLFDVQARMAQRFKSEKMTSHFGTSYDSMDTAAKTSANQWWSTQEADPDTFHHFQHEIEHMVLHECQELMKEAVNKLPGEVINRVAIDVGYEHLWYEAIEETLRATNPEVLDQILKNADGTVFTINGKKIEHLYDLFKNNISNDPANTFAGYPQELKAQIDTRQALFQNIAYEMQGDVTLLQQAIVEKHVLHARGLEGGIHLNSHDTSMHDAVMGIVPDDSVALAGDHARKARIKTYIETIRRKVGEAPPAGGPLKDSYTNYLAKRFADGREHNIFTTNDIPFDQFRFGNWGSSVPSRTTGDALAISNGEKMMGSLFGKFEGHMDEADFYKAVTEIKSTMAAADPGVGLNAAGFLNNARYAFYRESNFATRTGLFGRMMTSETVIELSEWASKLPGIRKLTKGKIPGWMWGNEAQQIVGAGAERLSASDIWTNTREADEKLLLPKTHHPLGWSGSGYKQGQGFTKEEMRVRYNANILKDLLPQAIFTVSPIAVGLIILQALKEESESGGGGHH